MSMEAADVWESIQRLSTFRQLRYSVSEGQKIVNVSRLSASENSRLIERLVSDNLGVLGKIRARMDRAGLEEPTVEVRYNKLSVESSCEVVHGNTLPTLWNSLKVVFQRTGIIFGLQPRKAEMSIIKDFCGIIMPGRLTLLLGPPGCGKTTFLKALSGNLNKSLKVTGDISYNGYKLEEINVQKTSAYISQQDGHIPDITVRETLDFSSCCQGIGNRLDILVELIRREKELKIVPDPDVDIYMKAIAVEGQKTNLQTDYILKILGLETCANTLVGNVMKRGISGGQKKRLTTGEKLVGPAKVLFMDEISNGLDSSTTFEMVSFLQQVAHMSRATILVSLLQPPPETFDLFDDIILMGEGKIVYHGPRLDVLNFFHHLGFKCPPRKGVPDFLQEVISRNDQEQYWYKADEVTYEYISVDTLSRKYKESLFGKNSSCELAIPFDRSKTNNRDAIIFKVYSLPKWILFRACFLREVLLMKRNYFVYVFKTVQLVIIASISMTVFFKSRMSVTLLGANYYLGALFYSLVILVVDAQPELALTVERLEVFYKQRDSFLYPAWAYAIPATILKIPLSVLEAVVWTSLTYYTIGYTPEAKRFFCQMLLFFGIHLTSMSMYRFVAVAFRDIVVSSLAAGLLLLFIMLLGGFIIPRSSMPVWLKWAFWVSPLTYGEIGLSINEFLASRWQKQLSGNTTLGHLTLESRGLMFDSHYLWICIAALMGFAFFFNTLFAFTLTFFQPLDSHATISSEKLSEFGSNKEQANKHFRPVSCSSDASHKGKMVLPFEPLCITFQDVQYFIEPSTAMKQHGFTPKKLQLLRDITGSFRPGVLTALMGVSGVGKTTLLDVLSGRKTIGTMEGDIKVGGYPKIQKTFARISGYCEQTNVHSPQITVEESISFSAWLRLHPDIDPNIKHDFVKQVLDIMELDSIKDGLVGMSGVDGLSTEERKRLTIAVELVANPSIMFMDEPTTGLDARSSAIVMRVVKNVADTGRTIVCTIHQPSIDIFEAFDELIVLKTGGRIMYCGPLGYQSTDVIQYFEGISGVPKIRENRNPATWMLEVTSSSSEAQFGVDFSQLYMNSALHEINKEVVRNLSIPPPGSKEMHFPTTYSQNGWGQFKSCLWKQYWSYWRSPSYNLMRLIYMVVASFLFGSLFWDHGKKIHNQQSLFTSLGAMFSSTLFIGVSNSKSILKYIHTERAVLYRERFAGMYASWAYSTAQVIIEIPYVLAQSLIFTIITYPMIGYYWSAYKVFWYLYTMFCTLLYYTYLGMLLIAITPSFPIASVLQSAFYTMFNLFAGYIIPPSRIPGWWIWFYYAIPTSWSLNGLFTSQYGDIQKEITVFGQTKSVGAFVSDYFGYDYQKLPLVAVVLALYPIVFSALFAYFIGKLNFQRR